MAPTPVPDISALLEEAAAIFNTSKGHRPRAAKYLAAADWLRIKLAESSPKHRPPSDPVSRRLRALYGHRAYGEHIGIPWAEWASLKEEYMAHYHITDLVRNDRYPDAVLLTHDEREASAVVRSAADQVRGWFFFPVIR